MNWISVKDRLPYPGSLVWAVFPEIKIGGCGMARMLYDTDYGGEWEGWWFNPMNMGWNVPALFKGTPSHWMPIPDPLEIETEPT